MPKKVHADRSIAPRQDRRRRGLNQGLIPVKIRPNGVSAKWKLTLRSPDQEKGFHGPLTFDVETATRFEYEVSGKQLISRARHLDAARKAE